jgi:hypothetical protein
MYDTYLTDNIREAVRSTVADDPNMMLDQVAVKHDIPEGAAAAALDRDICFTAPAAEFESIWQMMTRWEKVTFIATTPGAIVEIKGKLPQGQFGHGFFNIGETDNPLGGHLKIDQLHAICFVSKPFMGLESHSVRFYNRAGELMFAVYVGRKGKNLIAGVKDQFMSLRRDFAEKEAR